ncbi:NRDE protein-domain-containing protein [Aspergillus crustosus]
MCIAILTTTHPNYRYIIINNRDEFLSRPTAPASWWSPSPSPSPSPISIADPVTEIPHILSARDLARPAHGIWLGVTKEGRAAVLTNCLETDCARAVGGEDDVEGFIEELRRDEELQDVGGFNLLFRDLSELQSHDGDEEGGLVIISNRSATSQCCTGDSNAVRRIGGKTGETIALSNMTLGEEFDGGEKWTKIVLGEELLGNAVGESLRVSEDEDALVERFFDVLLTDTLPRLTGKQKAEACMGLLRESIFIPVIGEKVQHNQEGVHSSETLLHP